MSINESVRSATEKLTGAVATITSDHAYIHDGIGFTLSGKMDIASAKVGGLMIQPPTDVKAAVTVDMTNANADLTYTAADYGTSYNGITVTHVDPSANDAELAVTVSGHAITVSLATGPAGAITSTAAEVVAAVNAVSPALVVATDEGDGSGIVNAAVAATLTGGSNKAYVHFKPATLSVTGGPVYASLIEDATFTGGSALTPECRNRIKDTASIVPCYGLQDITVVNGANVTTLETAVVPGNSIAGKIGSQANSAEEWVLAPGKSYVLAITNVTNPGATVTAGYSLFWYEEEAG